MAALLVAGCVQPPATTRAERVKADAGARADAGAAADRCEQARKQMQQVGTMRTPTIEMTEDMQQCNATAIPGVRPAGQNF